MNWDRQEAGWYTSEIGGITKEKAGWFFYPRHADRIGPYRTCRAAMDAAVKWQSEREKVEDHVGGGSR